MPAIYAHDRFGKMVYEKLDGKIKKAIKNNFMQYSTGLQGPDIFFFYRPLKSNDVSAYGNRLHQISAYPFFENAVNVLKKDNFKEDEFSYIAGFICHYMLDSECHGYVDEMIKKTGASHLEIEEEFEKMLLRKDKENPFSYPLKDLVFPNKENASSIAPFYKEDIDEKTVLTALKDMKMLQKIFTCPGKFGQKIRNGILKAVGKEENKWIMHQLKDNPNCDESNRGLLERLENAVDPTVEIIYKFVKTLENGDKLDIRFDRNFE